eukprot:TRINITY_DN14312_c0_g1_i1.p1 TRINITY_DN14312_c0_g1~~TRINITY_DN14312_c0_g1_i1.p1  ORF type:complete len:659 (-),score=102.00 TRINITY_DN14312_c0_g1_i1:427-2295(-)
MGQRGSCIIPGRGRKVDEADVQSRHSLRRLNSFRQNSSSSSIVPDEDPLMKSFTRRIVHDDVTRDYDLTPQVLGTGYSGAVRLGVHHESKRQVAVKHFSKTRLKPHRVKLLQSEVEVYLRLDHPNICRLLHAYEGKHDVWLVMELCGSELYSQLCKCKVYTEADAAEVLLQMLQAINYLHSHKIVHRDLKLENWMHGSPDCDREDRLKLIDFGFSRVLCDNKETLDMPCGTLHYTSPEVLGRRYTNKCDIWSLGVICYMLLMGRPPFRGQNSMKIAKSILNADFPRDGRWSSLSNYAKNFVEQLLRKDPNLRPDAMQALSHAWLTGASSLKGSLSAPSPHDVGLDVLRRLRQFAQGSHLRRAALTVLAYSLTSSEIEDLEETFFSFDRSGRGTITLEQLADVLAEYCQAAERPELSTAEVRRIFESLDVDNEEEVHYTPFVAAMLGTRVKQHEDKIRDCFEAFDQDGSGFITADSLVRIFSRLPSKTSTSKQLTEQEAEEWIREIDYKGNGVIDYDSFLDALMAKPLWSPLRLDNGDDQPVIRMFGDEDELSANRVRAMTDPETLTHSGSKLSKRVRHGLAEAIIDTAEMTRIRSYSFPINSDNISLQLRTICCEVNQHHFV